MDNPKSGPAFGSSDLVISDNCNIVKSNTKLGNCYENNTDQPGLDGRYLYFLVDEIEVF